MKTIANENIVIDMEKKIFLTRNNLKYIRNRYYPIFNKKFERFIYQSKLQFAFHI